MAKTHVTVGVEVAVLDIEARLVDKGDIILVPSYEPMLVKGIVVYDAEFATDYGMNDVRVRITDEKGDMITRAKYELVTVVRIGADNGK